MWNDLNMNQRAEVIAMAVKAGLKDVDSIREFYNSSINKYDEGGNLSDSRYYSIMEKVVKDNNNRWNRDRISEGAPTLSEEEELTRVLNDNSYDYRGYYNKYPASVANADTHWDDEFKTAFHPTFSTLSRYSGKKSQYNPLGLIGGYRADRLKDGNDNLFIPAGWQLLQNKKYDEGGELSQGFTRPNGNPISFDSEGNLTDQITGDKGTLLLDNVTVKGHTPTFLDKAIEKTKKPVEDAIMFMGSLPFRAFGLASYGLYNLFGDKNSNTYSNAHTPFGQGLGHERDNIINVRSGIAGQRDRLAMMGAVKGEDDKYRFRNPNYVPNSIGEQDEDIQFLKEAFGLSDAESEYLKWCAENANRVNSYYHRPTAGNAWTRHGIYGDSAIVVSPHKKSDYIKPLRGKRMSMDQAQYIQQHIDDPEVSLHSGDIVDMYYGGSSFLNTADREGDIDRVNTHTGTILKTGRDKDHTYVIHSMGDGLKVEPIGDLLGSSLTRPYITAIRRPGTAKHPYPRANGGYLFEGGGLKMSTKNTWNHHLQKQLLQS